MFRYALERWPAANFQATIYHRSLSTVDQQQISTFSNLIQQLGANLSLSVSDLRDPVPAGQTAWQQPTNAVLPWLVVHAPDSDPSDDPIWAGRFADFDPPHFLQSPARNELANHLLAGDSVVWLLIESDDAGQNESVAIMLTNELKNLEATLKLPPSAPDDPAPRSDLPLRIAFPIQRVARHGVETLFVHMLLGGEDVPEDKPAVVPVFGRGRALRPLSGLDLTPRIIRQAAMFLCGVCSCEVKELNPGSDLLLAARWDSIFNAAEEPTRTSAPKTGQRVQIAPGNGAPALQPQAAPSAPRARLAPNTRRGLRLLTSVGLAISAICVLLVGIVLLRSLRQR